MLTPMMHLDCYDRRILAFVLNRASNERLAENDCRNWFGISPNAVMRRFNAVVDVYVSHEIPLEEPDLSLLSEAAHYRPAE
jgi:hypothetical protein